jgi:hypothetical protein
MKKKYLILTIVFVLLISCSQKNAGDKNIGVWQVEKKQYMNVKKAGDKGYFLIFTTYRGGYKSNFYCEFKDGCYYKIADEKEIPVFCVNGNKMIDAAGNIYTKKLK